MNDVKIIDLSVIMYRLKHSADPELLETDVLDLLDFNQLKKDKIDMVRICDKFVDVTTESWDNTCII